MLHSVLFSLLLVSTQATPLLKRAVDGFCWKRTYGRGVGAPISDCPSDQDKDGGLCYPKCAPKLRRGKQGR